MNESVKSKLNWRTPALVAFKIEDLVCKIKARAWSPEGPTCDYGMYVEENACPEISVENTWGDGGGGPVGCTHLGQCIEVGPLNGCSHDLACSSLLPVL